MKAILMVGINGRLMELERLEIEPTPVYYRVVKEPMGAMLNFSDVTMNSPVLKREVWLMRSRPVSEDDFAVFLFDRIDS